ncbi:chromate transporter [Paenibacillus koleovorans]|uniref:chromate transporter n=1 Tax=Paenibacillus koleovorans TaxID=121608 RepID=UPI000FD9F5BE|nr:chromate transporter [Paenibacillus koleovorans]
MNSQPSFKLLLQIFWTFFKIGPVTFGGGYAMIPLIEREVVEKRKWVRTSEIADMFAVSESIPGAIAINSASLVGFRVAGIRGTIAALLGVLLPTFLIVLGLCILFLQVKDNPKIIAAFRGIRITIVALIVYAAIKIGKTAVIDKTTLLVTAGTVLLLLVAHVNPVFIIMAGAVLGILLVTLKAKLGFKVPLEHVDHDQEAVEEGKQAAPQMRFKYTDYYLGDGI